MFQRWTPPQLVRGEEPTATVLPQLMDDHPTAPRRIRDRPAVLRGQLRCRERRTEVRTPIPHDRHRSGFGPSPAGMIARLAAKLRHRANALLDPAVASANDHSALL